MIPRLLLLLSTLVVNVVPLQASVLATPSIATAWYAGWHAADFPLSKVSWKKYTQVTYAFA